MSLASKAKQAFCSAAWRVRNAVASSCRRPVILLYHGVPNQKEANGVWADVFEDHVLFLKEHFELVPAHWEPGHRSLSGKLKVALTFDDGFRNNATVVAPILRKHDVPGLFFVSDRHSEGGKFLWFAYCRGLSRFFTGAGFEYAGRFWQMAGGQRQQTLKTLRRQLLSLRPHPSAMYDALEEELPALESFAHSEDLLDLYAGMTSSEVAELSRDSLFEFGAHTADHCFLTDCEPEEQARQLRDNKSWLESVTGRPCRSVSYPSGDYSPEVIECCMDLGFERGYAVRVHHGVFPHFEIPRLGVYAPSLAYLGFKAVWGDWLRALDLKVG